MQTYTTLIFAVTFYKACVIFVATFFVAMIVFYILAPILQKYKQIELNQKNIRQEFDKLLYKIHSVLESKKFMSVEELALIKGISYLSVRFTSDIPPGIVYQSLCTILNSLGHQSEIEDFEEEGATLCVEGSLEFDVEVCRADYIERKGFSDYELSIRHW